MELPPYHRIRMICKWKGRGLIHDDYDALYDLYMDTFDCNHCNIEFMDSKDRHLDHSHITGKFRSVVCKKCNTHDSYIKYPNGYAHHLQTRTISTRCGCGGKISQHSTKIHTSSKRHQKFLNTA